MYLERLPGIQARMHAYQEMTKNLELLWRLPVPVPAVRRSQLYDYYFSWGRFQCDDGLGATLAVFAKNMSRHVDLRDPHGFMAIKAPYGSIEDLIVIFHTHISEKDMGTLTDSIRVIKGVKAEVPWALEDAERFTITVNKEIAKLFLLGIQSAQGEAIVRTEIELSRIESISPVN